MVRGTLYGMVTMKVSNDCTDLAVKSFLKHTTLKEKDKFVMIDNDGDWYHNWNNNQINSCDIIINESLQNTSKNINQLILLAKKNEQNLVFISNDVIFTPRWQERIVVNDNTISIPSCNQTHNYGFPDSMSVVDFGSKYGILNTISHKHFVTNKSPFERLIMPIYVCRIPYDVFNKVGLLDESFNVGGEDVDYRIRLLKEGFDIKYCSAFLLHLNGKSSWNGAESFQQTEERDKKYIDRFKEKWGEDLANLCIIKGNPMATIDKYNLQSLLQEQRFNDMILEVLNRE